MTLGQVVFHIHRSTTALIGFTRGQLGRYESGETERPDPLVLLWLARIYDADMREWLELLNKDREEHIGTLSAIHQPATEKGARKRA